MKRFFPLALILLIFSSCHFKIKHTKEEALEQNDKVITTLNPYYDAEDKFEGALADDESDIKTAYAEFKTAIDKVISDLEAIPAFDPRAL